jgi:hypothetical protein
MISGEPARTTYRIHRTRATSRLVSRLLVRGLLVVIAAIAAAHGYQSLTSSSWTPDGRGDTPRVEHGGGPGEAAGDVPGGATIFDDEIPELTNLDPDLLGALREAATDAAGGGVEFLVNSGWRSPEYQDQLLQDAVSEYGSEAEAARWVASAETSPHVSGDAVDIGSSDATAWLSEHGAAFGLCQIYANEPWHYELRPEAVDDGCPALYPDPTHDPRMDQ